MRRLLLAIVLLLALNIQSNADGRGYRIYLPIAFHQDTSEQDYHTMSNWKIIVPEATTNKTLNPSGEIAANFAAVGGTVTRVTTYAHYGIYSYRLQTAADNQGATFTLSALTNAVHYVTMRVRGTLPAAWDWSLDNATYNEPALIEAIDADWNLYGFSFPAAQANGATLLYVYQKGAGAGDFFVDGIQVEAKAYWTTYCDGSQEGCTWAGAANASYSTRSAISRAGGRVKDLQTDYYFDISGFTGGGYVPVSLSTDSYALLPGAQLNNIKMKQRVFTLTGVVRGTTLATMHTKKQALIEVLAHDAYPADAWGWQPCRLIYTGDATQKVIKAYYEGGLEGDINSQEPHYWERSAIRFIAPDPFFRELGNSAGTLATIGTDTFSFIAGRLASTGQWNNLGGGMDANYVYDFALSPDGSLIAGGSFHLAGGVANTIHIAKWNGSAWSALDTGTTNPVFTLAFGPDGTLYAGGTAYLQKWDGSTWTSIVGGAFAGIVYALSFGLDGMLYAGGSYATIDGVAAANIAKWDGTTWSVLGVGTDSSINDLAVGIDGSIYAGGLFHNAGGGAANHIAKWDGSAWSALGVGTDDAVYTLAVGPDGSLMAGGIFDNAGGILVSHIAKWDGTSWSALGVGVNSYVNDVVFMSGGSLVVGGAFSTAGDIALSDCVAIWDGTGWSHLDVNLPGTAIVYAINVKNYNDGKYDLFLGFSSTGVVATGGAGTMTATNTGNQPSYPVIYFKRTGGTSATIATLRNETTGKELLFNYALLDGETLTIDLTPTKKSVTSSFFGPRFDAILANSDFGTFNLQPGSNQITSFVINNGATVTAWMEWQEAYKSVD